MTNAQTGTLVLKDRAGSYFLVTPETLEQSRVPEERRPELERLITTAAQGGGDDVQGYVIPAIVVGMILGDAFLVGFAAGFGVTKGLIGDGATAPTLDLSGSASPEPTR
ncbi:MAG: hypothetical protein HYX51_08775 [Chloroflexi bacterium]|nr:hypothetical protein [Chloroflexota bacterium]